MILNDSIDLINKEKRRQERIVAVHKFVTGVVILAAACVAIRIIFSTKKRKENGSCKKKIVD